MTFPTLSNEFLHKRLDFPKGKVRMVLDTDTYNEIDDQFALVYAMLCPEKLKVEAIYAAPYTNDRSTGPADGMEKSFEEILRLLERLKIGHEGLVFRGSTQYLSGGNAPQRSEAVEDLIRRAQVSPEDDPLYVVAIGAITNVAAALLLEPEIIRKIVVVWLGGHTHHTPHTMEFNLMQDPDASRVIFDSGVPFVQIPCLGVASHLLTTKTELDETLKGRNPISDFLYERFIGYSADHFAWAKEIWDISAIAYLLNESWLHTEIVPSPLLVGETHYEVEPEVRWHGKLHFEQGENRHPMRAAWFVHRNPIFRDLFTRLQNFRA
jgi:purine nucleosidase